MDHPTHIVGNEQLILSRMMGGAYAVEEEGDWIGPYRLIEQLGEGGFGTVWRAQQTDPIEREVALKVIKRGMDTRQVLARFEQERQSLAAMEHPCIATMLDAGASADGRPYFAMELVPGESLTEWCEKRRSPLHMRLFLFNQVCQAVNHAHQKGVIHRDLKPSNILVTSVDSTPTPKVIDFGIAKAIHNSTLTEKSVLTHADQIIGTPLYMSPEQLDGALVIDTRSDIYSLGVLLYELLTGTPPFHNRTQSVEVLKRSIREASPERPSTLIQERKRLTGDAPLIAPSLDSDFPNYSVDLDWITMRALEKDPSRRYQTAIELAEDIHRFAISEPVLARPPSFGYIAGRWIKRNRVAFAAACTVLLAIFAGAAAALWQAKLARAAQATAETQRTLAIASEARAVESAARAHTETEQARKNAAFLTELLDRVAKEIDQGRNPEALKLALLGSEERIAALGANLEVQIALLERVAAIYGSIGETKQLIPLLKARAQTAAKLSGPDSEVAWKAELDYLKQLIDHGNRITAPPLVLALRKRVEATVERGSKLWFDVQRVLIRSYNKLKVAPESVAAAEECLAALSKSKTGPKSTLTLTLACVESFELAGDFTRASELLLQCTQLNEKGSDSRIAEQIMGQRVHLCWSQRDFAGGAVLLREIVDGLKKKHGDQSPEVLPKLIELTNYEIDAAEYESALLHGQEALRIARTNPQRRDDYVRALIALAKSESYAEHFDKAVGHAEEGLVIAKQIGKADNTQLCVQTLAILHEDAGHLEQAASFYQLHQQHVEAEHANYKDVLEIMEEVCSIRVKQGRVDEAMTLAQGLWSRLKAEPESANEAGFTAEIANQCIVAWKAYHAAKPHDPEPPQLSGWQAATAAATPTENYFTRLRRRRS